MVIVKVIRKIESFLLTTALFLCLMTGCGMKDTQSTEAKAKQPSSSSAAKLQPLPYDGNYPQHKAYGTGIGAKPGRVVWSHNPDSVEWDGSGYWWETKHFDKKVMLKMVNDSIA